MVNKFHYLRGGCERYVFGLRALLERHGHQVIPFATRHPQNIEERGDAVWVEGVDFDETRGVAGGIRTAMRVVYSRDSRQAMAAALDRYQPDVVHFHNIAHHFSPSIVLEAGARGVPTVQTLHDFKLVCPTYLFLSRGEICERCEGHKFYHATLRRCNRGSWTRSAVSTIESYVHRVLGSYERIGRFLCPSRFLLDKMVTYGVEASRLVHLPLFVDPEQLEPRVEVGDYAIFVGRLSSEKGVDTLIEAARRAPDMPLVIVGEGPLRASIEEAVSRYALSHVRLTGRLDGGELYDTWRGAAFTIVPSEVYENFPMAVVESMALAKPVVASRLGGLAELVGDGETGVLVTPGAADELADVMRQLAAGRAGVQRMGQAARAMIEHSFTPERHYEELLQTYAAVGVRPI